jgi:3-carboxy-cis,cis-muconate cycloisomerase
MLRTEAALAAVQAELGLIPAEHARQVEKLCRGPLPDIDRLGAEAALTGTPVVPMLDALRAMLEPDVAASLHRGATSQDIVDTATMLTAAGAVGMIQTDLDAALARAYDLALTHAETPMTGRTLLRAARPMTFGAKVAVWTDGLEAGLAVLTRVRTERLAVQLGGPVGTIDEFGPEPQIVTQRFAERLGLSSPASAWHAERSRVAELAGALGVVAAAVAKAALDIVHLAQSEIGEVGDDDPARGGSSSMPHKRNPVAAVLARASAMRAPGLVADILVAAASGEHERGAGAWHAEWAPLRDLIVATGSAVAWLCDALEHLTVSPDRMRQNLEATGLATSGPAIDAAARVARRLVTHSAGRSARPCEVRYVESGGEQTSVVILSNSLGSTLAMWDRVVAPVATRHRVVRYDLRGHGASPTPPGPYAIADLGADLLDLLDRIGASRASLVGSSIGGMVSMWVAANAPQRVDRLVLIGSAARLGPAQGWIDRSRRALHEGTAGIAEAVTPRWVAAEFAANHPDAMKKLRAMFEAADPAGYAGCCMAIAGMDQTGDLNRITARTLVVVGSDDEATPRGLSEAIVEAVPGSRLAVIEGAAHLPGLDRPEEVAALIVSHLA